MAKSQRDIEKLDGEFAELIRWNCHSADPEANHSRLDDYVRDLLLKLGCKKTVKSYDAVQPKWTA